MKKIILTVVCAIIATASFAQRASSSSTSFFSTERSDQPITFGVRAGLNFANMSWETKHSSLSLDSRTAFNVGLSVDIPLLQSLYVQSGLYYSSKGSIEDLDDAKTTISPMYLEIPVLASYRYDVSDAAQVQLNVGPYFGYGIGGKYKEEYRGNSYESDFFDDDDINKFDCGLQIGAGVTISKIYVGCAYQFGMTNVAKEDDLTVKNKNFMINVGYNF